MKLPNNSTAIILPLKESFSNKNFGAVSVWVNDYINNSKIKDHTIFCRKIERRSTYLNKYVYPISINSRFYTNSKYIRNINLEIIKLKITNVEIHNRPEYAVYLIENNPNIIVNLIFHNDPNTLRYSKTVSHKKFLLNNCNKVIFVSE